MKEKQILVVTKHPGQPAQIDPLFSNELKAFQEFVGGYIETYTFSTNHTLLCNEEGLIRGMPFNTFFLNTEFYGPIMIVGYDEEGEFRSVKAPSFLMRELNRGDPNA